MATTIDSFSVDAGHITKQMTVNVTLKRVREFSIRASIAGYTLGASCYLASKILGCKGDFSVELVNGGDKVGSMLKEIQD